MSGFQVSMPMDKMKLFHGGIHVVDYPVCAFGRDNLDFGKGFYLTEDRAQAIDWAKKVAARSEGAKSILNIYDFDKGGFLKEGRALILKDYDVAWLRFIVDSRKGRKPWAKYDYIEGGVANDRVIDTVNLYIAGLMDINMALGRLSMHRPNNQICLLSHSLTDKYLKFVGYEYV